MWNLLEGTTFESAKEDGVILVMHEGYKASMIYAPAHIVRNLGRIPTPLEALKLTEEMRNAR